MESEGELMMMVVVVVAFCHGGEDRETISCPLFVVDSAKMPTKLI